MITLFIIYQCRRIIRQYKQKRNAESVMPSRKFFQHRLIAYYQESFLRETFRFIIGQLVLRNIGYVQYYWVEVLSSSIFLNLSTSASLPMGIP